MKIWHLESQSSWSEVAEVVLNLSQHRPILVSFMATLKEKTLSDLLPPSDLSSLWCSVHSWSYSKMRGLCCWPPSTFFYSASISNYHWLLNSSAKWQLQGKQENGSLYVQLPTHVKRLFLWGRGELHLDALNHLWLLWHKGTYPWDHFKESNLKNYNKSTTKTNSDLSFMAVQRCFDLFRLFWGWMNILVF